MLLISHRGNIDGPNKDRENNPEYIQNALNNGYEVEVDIWFKNNSFYLGHDKAEFLIDENFLKKKKLWFHAKNYDALKNLKNFDINYFWHQEDDYTITSKGNIWVYPGKVFDKNSIAVLPERFTDKINLSCEGVCSDYIERYK